ncbi:uncharacterized protein [Aristolochia californica]|uniref:uncharacterized protein n=1 Tax=Aristolochia californica TaxID=171875 RepID=UPI0035E157DC
MVDDYVSACQVCQCNKRKTLSSVGLLQPLHLPTQVWVDVSMDFTDGLPKSSGKSLILVVVDRFSKYGHFILLSHPYTASHIAQIFMDHIVVYGWEPPRLVSYIAGFAWVATIDQTLEERDRMLAQVRANLQRAQALMKNNYDKTHRDQSYAPRYYVWLRLHKYHQLSLTASQRHKLSPKYYGPFQPFKGDSSMLHTSLLTLHDGRVLPNPARVFQARRNNDC